MFSVKWEKLIVSDGEFSALKSQVGVKTNIRINFLSHETLDKLYVMVFPDGSMTIPKGIDYLNFGPFLEVKDFERQPVRLSQTPAPFTRMGQRVNTGWTDSECNSD